MVFEKGELVEIRPVESEEETEIEVDAEAETKAEVIKEIMKWEVDVINSTFEVGEALQYDYEDVTYSVGAGEYMIADGRTIVTDADGIIVTVKDGESNSEEVEQEVDEAIDVEALLKDITENVIKEVTASLQNENKELNAEIKALKKLVGSEDISVQPSNQNNNTIAKKNESKAAAILATLK